MPRSRLFAVSFAALLLGAFTAASPATDSPAFYFPPPGAEADWQTIRPADAGFDAAKLDLALDYARRQRSSGVVILYHGRILAEGYWNPDDVQPDRDAKAKGKARQRGYDQRIVARDAAGRVIEDVASVQKSISAILAGMAQERGLLKISDPVHKYLSKGWSKAAPQQEAAITIRHLITMTSGLDEALKYEAPPGTRWFYNSAAYSRTLMCTAAAAKLDRNELTRRWLTGPIGMSDSKWWARPVPDPEAAANAVGFATSARDLARFGLLMLASGDWRGQSIIKDKQFLHDVLHPSQQLNPSYGYLWWLNGQPKAMRGGRLVDGPLIPTAPPDIVAALGAFHRKLYVCPSLGLVVTRLGDNPPEAPDAELWRRIMAARINP